MNQTVPPIKTIALGTKNAAERAQHPGTPEDHGRQNQTSSNTDVVDDDSENDSTNTNETRAEYGGVKGPEPTRFGDWEKSGRCIDF